MQKRLRSFSDSYSGCLAMSVAANDKWHGQRESKMEII